MVNVPTVVWVDEQGRVARPKDTVYVSDAWRKLHGIDPEPHRAAIRAWVREGTVDVDPGAAAALHPGPGEQDELARTEFALGRHLAQELGRREAAEPHFRRAGELAPHDWTIRRGSLPMRGRDPAGPDWYEAVRDWVGAGNTYYQRLPTQSRPAG